MSTMYWTNGIILRFLDLYKTQVCLWNPMHEDNKNRKCTDEAWLFIQDNMGVECTVKDLKKKKESLMSAYRAYKIKAMKAKEIADNYYPIWFAFPLMDSFLGYIYKRNRNFDKEDENYEPTIKIKRSGSRDENMSDTENSSNIEQHFSPDPLVQDQERHFVPIETVPRETLKRRLVDSSKDDEEECDIFGRLIAMKLQKMPQKKRDLMMVKIHQLLYEKSYGESPGE